MAKSGTKLDRRPSVDELVRLLATTPGDLSAAASAAGVPVATLAGMLGPRQPLGIAVRKATAAARAVGALRRASASQPAWEGALVDATDPSLEPRDRLGAAALVLGTAAQDAAREDVQRLDELEREIDKIKRGDG